MAIKMDAASIVIGMVIAVGALAIYDYLLWSDGGILKTEPSGEWY